ncbi:hypothetical protein XBJ2_500010 [Xenorhabdus bovienii str. Jollieti]|uniref:Uncharacterized protein n=2 Tax=Xenorhabdus bovienii TaxID=40576 RepID=D3V007_XENBS|nr:hypothetical protein XBJ1_1165 [Xenorhabdus bovienii SS-2004]CDH30035.1 hypothetical protein XBJ2_500010 [Xenorhabdus bovienii str. Jollieti]
MSGIGGEMTNKNDDVMTDRELVNAAIKLAGKFYNIMGYQHRDGFEYWKSPHPQEQSVFEMAIQAFEDIRGSDVWDAIESLEDEN